MKYTHRQRPLATHGLEVMQTIATEHQAAFFKPHRPRLPLMLPILRNPDRLSEASGYAASFVFETENTPWRCKRGYLRMCNAEPSEDSEPPHRTEITNSRSVFVWLPSDSE